MAYTTIDDPSAFFQTLTYTGNGTDNRVITNDGNSDLKPDMVWIKVRNAAYNHSLLDSSRGVTLNIRPNHTNADITDTAIIKSFNTDGFTAGTSAYSNDNGASETYVAWQWKGNGGTTSTNTDGTLSTTVQANQDAGFSIVQWTGVGGVRTVGHGLGQAPAMVMCKNRTISTQWLIWHQGLDGPGYQLLFTTGAMGGPGGNLVRQTPTSTVFEIGSSAEVSNNSIAYCFAEKQGYSKFGKYVGNGSGTSDGTFNGPFVYTGFKPAWVMVKASSASSGDGWNIFDNKRGPINYNQNKLYADAAAAESGAVYDAVDFLSNGFKIRTGRGGANTSGRTYIYTAFAENPFVTSTGIPTTAR